MLSGCKNIRYESYIQYMCTEFSGKLVRDRQAPMSTLAVGTSSKAAAAPVYTTACGGGSEIPLTGQKRDAIASNAITGKDSEITRSIKAGMRHDRRKAERANNWPGNAKSPRASQSSQNPRPAEDESDQLRRPSLDRSHAGLGADAIPLRQAHSPPLQSFRGARGTSQTVAAPQEQERPPPVLPVGPQLPQAQLALPQITALVGLPPNILYPADLSRGVLSAAVATQLAAVHAQEQQRRQQAMRLAATAPIAGAGLGASAPTAGASVGAGGTAGTHNLIPGQLVALQQQQQVMLAAQTGPAALAAQAGYTPLPSALTSPNLIAADPVTATQQRSPLAFYGLASAPVGQPQAFVSSQHPPNPVPRNMPVLPNYGLPVDPRTGVPFLALQDMLASVPQSVPVYNGINPNYPGARLLTQPELKFGGTAVPPVYAVDNFLTPDECDFLISCAGEGFSPAPVVGKGLGEVSASRTSSTVYLAREDLPLYMEKVCRLVGKPRDHCELPQVGRYLPSQQYMQHFDAFDLSNEDGQRFAANGGQRVATVLVYLNDVGRGGETNFPALNLAVRPRRGMAVVFFPATVDGLLDRNALHAALPAVDPKFVSQVWIRQDRYDGLPSKRIFPSEDLAREAALSFRSPGPGAGTGWALRGPPRLGRS